MLNVTLFGQRIRMLGGRYRLVTVPLSRNGVGDAVTKYPCDAWIIFPKPVPVVLHEARMHLGIPASYEEVSHLLPYPVFIDFGGVKPNGSGPFLISPRREVAGAQPIVIRLIPATIAALPEYLAYFQSVRWSQSRVKPLYPGGPTLDITPVEEVVAKAEASPIAAEMSLVVESADSLSPFILRLDGCRGGSVWDGAIFWVGSLPSLGKGTVLSRTLNTFPLPDRPSEEFVAAIAEVL